jgi:hypothetical protein
MKLTTFLLSAVLALGVAAVDPEAGNDVEARDFSGESLNEFDSRSPDEEELETRDEEDLDARDYDYNPCKGKNVEYKLVDYIKKCVCTRTGEIYGKYGCSCKHGEEYSDKYGKCIPKCYHPKVYNPKTGLCEKPFYCKGKNVEIVTDNYGTKTCKCTREGEVYNWKTGCACKEGEIFSDKYNKCIPECHHPKVYNPKTGLCEKPFYCKGKNVEIVTDNYGTKSCKCTKENEVYNKWKGCVCKDGFEFSEKYHKCIPKCAYGTYYNGYECAPKCKGDYVVFKHGECKCLKPGFYYNKWKGCLPRCDGDGKWNGHECTCDYGKTYVKGKGCVDKCIKPAYFKKGHCECPAKDQYYKEHFGCKDRCEAENTHWNGYKCVCDRGTIYHGGKCVKPPTCTGYGAYFNEHKWKCVCKNKHEEYDNVKGCVKKCGPNEVLVEQYGSWTCVCKEGYKKTKWGCKKDEYGTY